MNITQSQNWIANGDQSSEPTAVTVEPSERLEFNGGGIVCQILPDGKSTNLCDWRL